LFYCVITAEGREVRSMNAATRSIGGGYSQGSVNASLRVVHGFMHRNVTQPQDEKGISPPNPSYVP
jgi:hypothetical protein